MQEYQLKSREFLKETKEYKVPISKELAEYLHSEQFSKEFYYDGELGAIYTKDYTQFKLWAPTALSVSLRIYDAQYGDSFQEFPMEKKDRGVYEWTQYGDLNQKAYVYTLTFEGYDETVVTNDPYSRATTANGLRSVIIDLEKAKPENWGERMPAFSHPVDAIIYELSIRDFTSHQYANILHGGLYLGLTQEETKTDKGFSTGLDYLTELGITHVQIMPFADFETVDERFPTRLSYNWGYDPANYNVPEGSYSTDPTNPDLRIRELRSLVQSLHNRGIRVIMDVVYNHVFHPARQSLGKTVPGYYFRYHEDGTLADGTGCGNETSSEQAMMRKYMVDSIMYWAKTFHLDGFRFDLMGMHDIETMNAIRHALDQIDPSILLLGEGWDMGDILKSEKKATQKNAYQLDRIACFNDAIRDSLKGKEFEALTSRGFITEKSYEEEWLMQNMQGAIDFPNHRGHYKEPGQVVQYIEVHDGFTLYDKLQISFSNDTPENRLLRHKLATTCILLSQGIPFLHSGQEFLRTKYGVENSYATSLSINQVNWKRREDYADYVDYVKSLISLRKLIPSFRLRSYAEIKEQFHILKQDFLILAFVLKGEKEDYVVILNGLNHPIDLPVEKGIYEILIQNYEGYLGNLQILENVEQIHVSSLDCMVLRKKK